jgi:hypothetical protein
VFEIERDRFFRRPAHVQRALRAIEPRIGLGVELEFDAKIIFSEAPHVVELVAGERDGHGLQAERQPALEQQFDGAHAAGMVTACRPAADRSHSCRAVHRRHAAHRSGEGSVAS